MNELKDYQLIVIPEQRPGGYGRWVVLGLLVVVVLVIVISRQRAEVSDQKSVISEQKPGLGSQRGVGSEQTREAVLPTVVVTVGRGQNDGVAIGARPGVTATATGPVMPWAGSDEQAWVIGIVDGDTIDVRLAGKLVRVRYIGVDTPERGQGGYKAAKEANRALVAGQVVMVRGMRLGISVYNNQADVDQFLNALD